MAARRDSGPAVSRVSSREPSIHGTHIHLYGRIDGEHEVADAVFVEAALAGDSLAFSHLYSRYHRYIARILADDVRDVEARRDIAQTVFERVWLKLSTLRDPAAFRPWLAQITRRAIIDHHRRVEPQLVASIDETQSHAPVADDWTAHDWAAMRELAEAVDTAINELSSRDATVIELAATFGFDAGEIGAALDVEPGHARVLLHRARHRLSRELLSVHGALA